MRERLRALGMTQRDLAEKAGIPPDVVRKYAQGLIDKPRGDVLTKIATILNVTVVWLEHGVSIRNMSIPLLGSVGAGEQFFPDMEGMNESITIKAEDLDLFAATVRGQSGLPVYKPGEVVVCSRSAGLSENSYLNTDAVVMLRSGQAYLKKIVRGSQVGTFTLLSYNGEPIENVLIEWAAPVVMVLRRPALLQTN